jgi:DNA-binding FrmR family transcriptional regulator
VYRLPNQHSTLSRDVLESSPTHHHDSRGEDKSKILTRLRRIDGQVRGVAKMVEEDKYWIDRLTQLSAIVSSSRYMGLLVREDQDERLTELDQATERSVRSVG